MNPGFARRLVLVQSVAISLLLLGIVLAGTLIAFGVYAHAQQAQLDETIADVAAYVDAHGPPATARELADAVATRFFRPDVDIVMLDEHRRVEIRSRTPDSSRRRLSLVAVDDVARTSSPSSRPPPPPAARLAIAAASFFGLNWAHGKYGSVDVIVRPDDRVFSATIARFVPGILLAVLFSVVLGIVLARLLAREALRPLDDVTKALERFADGDLSPQPIPADSKQQLGALAVAYNGAIAQMADAFAERDEANAAMQQFIMDAGHQLRTPLTVIRGFIGILRRGDLREPHDRERILETMNRQSLLMGTMIDRLMLLDRWEHSTSDARPIDVSQLVEDVVTPISEAAAPRHVRLDVAPGALAAIDPSELGHAVTNLLDNALKYTGGSVDVRVRQSPAQVEIEVADEGPGMAPRELAHAFDRFYRGETRRNVEGSGLGLSIAKAAVERARGTLRVQSGPAGTRFTIALPPSRTASLERPVEVTTT